jgi:branched-chain amino acid transport system substrate-binding protein
MKKTIQIALVLALAVLLVAGNAFAGGQKEQAAGKSDVVKFGAAVSLTGAQARFGNMVKNGYELWKDEINAQGGIMAGGAKKKVEVIYYDDQSDNQTAAKLTEKLITEDKVQFLLGPYSSGITFATTAIAEKYNIISMATLANAPNIYERGFKNVFSVLPPGPKILWSFIDMIKGQKDAPKKVAIIAPNDLFPVSTAKGTKEYAEKAGLEVAYYEEYPKGVKDLSSTILKIKNSGAEALMGCGYLEDAILTMRQLKDAKVSLKAIAFTTGPELLDFQKALEDDSVGVCGVSWWMPEMKSVGPLFGSAENYAKLYQKKFGEGLTYQAAAASQGALLLQLAIEKADSTDTDKVREALKTFKASTFWGPISFDATGKNETGAAVTFQIQGKGATRGIKTVFPADFAQAKPLFPLQ